MELPGGVFLHLGPRTLVMGIVNVTPDSFSDGGRYLAPDAAAAHALALAADGADLVDVGGASSRPGAAPVPRAEELRRVVPVIEALAGRLGVPLSVDTTDPEVARAALAAGAAMVNDVSLLRDAALAAAAAAAGAPLILMHARGTPATMAAAADYPDGVLAGVTRELRDAMDRAARAGLAADRLLLDPGIGFAKSAGQSLDLLARLPRLAALGRPLVVGVSRKSFLGAVLDRPVDERLPGTLAAETAAVLAGAHVIRTHDVAACRRAVDLADALRRAAA